MNNNFAPLEEVSHTTSPHISGNFGSIFHQDNYDHYRNAVNSTLDLVQQFLYRNDKPFSGIEAKEMKEW
jgi:L-2,4-diaminobutyrate decarboxylase